MEYIELYSSYKDSAYNEETTNRIAELETQYQTEKKEQKIKKQQLRIKLIIVILVIVIIMLSIAVLMYLQRRKAQIKLVKMNLEAVKCERKVIESIQQSRENDKYKGSPLDEHKKQKLINNLIVLMEEGKFFPHTSFTIDDLARKLETNRQYLSQIINEHFQKNFNSFVNEFRIREARRMLLDPENEKYTIEGIAQTVGFKSRTSFISAFKKYTGVTPSFFRNNSDLKNK